MRIVIGFISLLPVPNTFIKVIEHTCYGHDIDGYLVVFQMIGSFICVFFISLFAFNKSVSINGLNYAKNVQVIVDNKKSYIYGDSSTITKLMNSVGASSDGNGGYYVKLSKVALMPGERTFFSLKLKKKKEAKTKHTLSTWGLAITLVFNGNAFILQPTEYTVSLTCVKLYF